MKTRTLLQMYILVILLCTHANAKIIYVDDDAAGANDGSSWQNAFTYLRDALAIAELPETEKPLEIRVAQGIYKPNQGLIPVIPPGTPGRGGPSPGEWPADEGRDATFALINNVTLKGGYAGINESDPNARNANLYKSILSGDLNDNDIDIESLEINSLNELIENPVFFDNSRQILIGSYTDETAILDGFVISAAFDHSVTSGNSPHGGGGLYVYSGSPKIINCTFKEIIIYGTGAGLLFSSGSNSVIENCIFTKNFSIVGGALATWENCSPKLINCTFNENYAEYVGGGMYNKRSYPDLFNCTFKRNHSLGMGAGMFNTGSNIIMRDCLFIENTGGSGGGIYTEDESNVSITKCSFYRNTAMYSGAIFNRDVNDTFITDSVFINNKATQSSGAISNLSNKTTITNCLFAGNIAYSEPPNISETGGLYVRSDTTISNCTFYGNWASERGRAITKYVSSVLKINNCIFWDGGDEIWHYSPPSTISVKYSNIKNGWEGQGNIDTEPLFANPGYWAFINDLNIIVEPNDANAVWIEGDYHLKTQAGRFDPNTQSWVQDDVTSPCIDAGDPNSPIGLEPFPNGGYINMGAYGGTAEASKSYFGEPLCETIVAGDINGDCKVDELDLEILMLHWLEDHNLQN